MDLGLNGKVAIIGGASRGLGKACAMALAAEGSHVAICARGQQQLNETAKEITDATGSRVLPLVTDMAVLEDIKRAVAETAKVFGRLDIAVSNAGGPPTGQAIDMTEEQWKLALDQNMMSAIRLSRESIPHMRKAGGGRIINILSRTVKQPEENMVLSNAVRLGLLGFAKTLASEVAKDKILVNNVLPGAILTDRLKSLMAGNAQRLGKTYEQMLAEEAAMVPLGRLGRPEELGSLVAFLASDKASYINGCTIQVDGGRIKAIL